MKLPWLRILLLCTFAYWGTGTAKFLHELVEHHGGRDDAVTADDDDGDVSTVVAAANAPVHLSTDGKPVKSAPLRHDQTCFLCQQLSAMAAEKSVPPALPALSLELVARLIVPVWRAPLVRFELNYPARGPPAPASSTV